MKTEILLARSCIQAQTGSTPAERAAGEESIVALTKSKRLARRLLKEAKAEEKRAAMSAQQPDYVPRPPSGRNRPSGRYPSGAYRSGTYDSTSDDGRETDLMARDLRESILEDLKRKDAERKAKEKAEEAARKQASKRWWAQPASWNARSTPRGWFPSKANCGRPPRNPEPFRRARQWWFER